MPEPTREPSRSVVPFSPTVTLLTVARVWDAAFTEALKPLGLTTRKYGLLGHVGASPGISFSELARRSRITVQSAHTAVAALAEAGWVGDDTGHAGSPSALRVTADGEALLRRAAEVIARLDEEFAARHPDLAEALRVHLDQVMG